MGVDFKKRAKVTDTGVSKLRSWETKCGRGRVVHSKYHDNSYAETYMAIVTSDGFERIISRHRTKAAAMARLTRILEKL